MPTSHGTFVELISQVKTSQKSQTSFGEMCTDLGKISSQYRLICRSDNVNLCKSILKARYDGQFTKCTAQQFSFA